VGNPSKLIVEYVRYLMAKLIYELCFFSVLLRVRYLYFVDSFIVDCGSTVVKVLSYKSEGRWFDPRRCHGIFH
jgi:hypothetical protein